MRSCLPVYAVQIAFNQTIIPMAIVMIWAGMARRISFSTPEGEVNGVAPVKFMARKELVATVNRARATPSPAAIGGYRMRWPSPAAASPILAPLTAKAFPGSHGSRIGARTAPPTAPKG